MNSVKPVERSLISSTGFEKELGAEQSKLKPKRNSTRCAFSEVVDPETLG
jgi:hypothetical protein